MSGDRIATGPSKRLAERPRSPRQVIADLGEDAVHLAAHERQRADERHRNQRDDQRVLHERLAFLAPEPAVERLERPDVCQNHASSCSSRLPLGVPTALTPWVYRLCSTPSTRERLCQTSLSVRRGLKGIAD